MKKALRVAAIIMILLPALTFSSSAAITAVTAVAENMCNGAANGSIHIVPAGGTAPYTYSWSNGATTQNLSGVIAGTYTVTITDNTGTTAGFTYTITQPAALVITKTIVNENCGGQNIGAVTLNITNPSSTYTFSWSNGGTTENIANLTAAEYFVTITDVLGCTTIDSANVIQPPGIGITDTVTDVTCSAGSNNGAIAVGIQYGNPAYTYLWNDGATTESRSALTTGTYTLTVTDALGCTATASATVSQLPSGMGISTTNTNPACYNGTSGSINVTSVFGSTSPYTYLWSDGSTSDIISGLGAGTYSVTVTSHTGCSVTDSVILTQPSAINVTIHIFPPTCYGDDNGAITSIASNGSSPYSYIWTGGDVTSAIGSLTAGNYTLTVTDHKGCTVSQTAVLTQPSQVNVTATPSPLSCSGGPTGAIVTSVNGGLGPYSYWWGGGVVSANRNNISAGIYTVTVTDANSCTGTGTATIAPYTPMSLTATPTAASCYGSNNGAINLTVNNGTAPYNYIWNDGDTSNNPDTLTAGTYTVTATDAKGCSATAASTVTAPLFAIVINDTISNVSCFGMSNGSISLDPVYGSPPYTYKWAGIGVTQSISGLAAGNYTVSISDNNGCSSVSTFTVTQPGLITPVTAVINVACFGGNNGAINLSVTGGYSPFSYVWNDGVHTQTRSGLHSGNYDVTITDNHGCTMTAATSVMQPAQLTAGAAGVNPACNGSSNGSVTITAAGGTVPYTYNWGGGINTQNRTGVPAGTYNVTITDSAGCTATATQTLTQPLAIGITSTGSAVACNGSNTGTIAINVTGGTAPYTYDWGGGITTQNRNNLAAGSYTVTVTDNALCTAANTTTVTQSSGLNATATATNAICFGSSNGSITTSITGGTSPYTYDWGGGINSSQRNNLAAGTYNVTITDHAGCSASVASVVGQPALLTVSANVSPVTCFGAATGGITITAAGGTGADTYSWGGGVTSQNRNNLTTGNYTVTVTDAAGCTVASSSAVTQPAQLTVNAASTNVSCNGGSDGTIQLTTAGGTGADGYNWGGGNITSNRTGLAQGTYTATVTDANGCSTTKSVSITQPAAITVTSTAGNVQCFGQSTGTITITVTGGAGVYTYNWGSVTTQNRTNLAAGNYAVTVTDANGCSAQASATITQPQQITVSTASVNNVSCNGASTGSIVTGATGGTPGYTYLWSNAATTQNLNNIATGTYTLSVTDIHGCTASSTPVTITQPAPITLAASVTNALCNGSATGAIATTVSGGNSGFIYHWNNAATTAGINNITAGSYSVTCQDVSGCSVSATAQVTQPSAITLTTSQTDVTCNGGNTGTASVQATGGTGAYTYNWTGGQTTAQISNLAEGNYSVTVNDANACAATTSVNISQINSIILNITSTNATCAGQANGSIQTTVSGGAGGYNYTWTGGATTANITALAAGTYVVTVVDANHCNTSASATITQPAAITITQTVTNATCFGSATGSIQLTGAGGTGAYQYHWSNGATTQNIPAIDAGSYQVTVQDANGCSVTGTKTVSQPAQLNVSISETNVTCHGGSNGSASSIVTGGTSGYSYLWSNSSATANISNVQANNYTLTVKDANNCTASATISVAQPAAITLQTTVTNVSCNGGSDGSVNLQASGGTGSYTYNWSNQSTTAQISQLNAGPYAVTVLDANACSAQAAFNITQPAVINITATVIPAGCTGRNNGSAEINAAGGTPPYLYNWSNQEKTALIDSLAPGTYTVTVNDNNGCASNKSLTITSSPALSVTPTVINASCTGVNNGSISVTINGGTAPYQYNWNDGLTSNTASDLASGNYEVTVTDSKGCSAVTGGSITAAYTLTVQATASADTVTTAPVQLDATTNTDHGNVYNWTPASIVTCSACANTASKPVETTLYTVFVTDTNGCKAEATVTVTVITPEETTPTATNIFIPNAFTPNGDGVNDQFKMFGDNLGDVHFLDLSVFDRWGEKVFETNDPNFEWDGTYKGEPAPMGVYVYVATVVFNTGDHKDLKGSVTLIR